MPVQAVSNKVMPAFKGSMSITDNGNEYYKTNNGLKVGATLGGFDFVSNVIAAKCERSSMAAGLIGGVLIGAIHTGIGAFIDHKRNQKAAEATDYIKRVGVKQAVMTRNDIYLSTNNGQPYYKSNVGAKYGTAIGAGIGAIVSILPSTLITAAGLGKLRSKELAATGVLLFAMLTSISALGGFILGKITDYFTNKAAEKNA